MKIRALSEEQILFIVKNKTMGNIELAKKLKTKPSIVGTYKTRLRKRGVDIPKYVIRTGNNIDATIDKVLEKNKITKTNPAQVGVDLAKEGSDKQVETVIEPEELEEEKLVPVEEELEEIPD
jgi:hypothetical protein